MSLKKTIAGNRLVFIALSITWMNLIAKKCTGVLVYLDYFTNEEQCDYGQSNRYLFQFYQICYKEQRSPD